MAMIAITGGTGFVGRHLIRMGIGRGHHIRALTRRDQPPAPHLDWISGALDRPDSLARLVEGADAVIHVAGVINAASRHGFAAGNIAGTEAMIAAAEGAGVRRFIHVSSLAAREPGLSDYGWSKLRSEELLKHGGGRSLDWTIIRPPAVYGPGDREMLELFRMARRGFVALPPAGRFSVIAAEDLCRLLLDLIDAPASHGHSYEPDDGTIEGWDHRDFALALGQAIGRRVRPLSMPARLLHAASFADGLVRRGRAKLTRDRVRYFCHPDWVSTHAARPPASLWRAEIATPDGLKATADWYRREGWL
ncbi:epimerase [Sphingomonas oleivorans]|uniref:Epimerase n=1 Tax=Sphingomonas oleivorans TaxID=1735121 RepID=A0A2T5FU38_9SPHN|nr:NAD-dependent epimerase/dehydratase family protein [Sphingomonas oleivorans]PTQ07790.1 epimerase [Sphingomonas oleivorans]